MCVVCFVLHLSTHKEGAFVERLSLDFMLDLNLEQNEIYKYRNTKPNINGIWRDTVKLNKQNIEQILTTQKRRCSSSTQLTFRWTIINSNRKCHLLLL